MALDGFDIDAITTLAGELEKASQGAGSLHRGIAAVLTRAADVAPAVSRLLARPAPVPA